MREIKKYRVKVQYDDVNKIKNMITSSLGKIKNIVYGEYAEIEFILENIAVFSNCKLEEIGSEKVWK